MAIAEQLHRLATYLAGEFDNRAQSLAEPAWFLHLRLWYRPLPSDLFANGHGFFIEQVSVASGQAPYRQRILHLSERQGELWGQFYALAKPEDYIGSAREPQRLEKLDRAALLELPTCGLAIAYEAPTESFRGRAPTDEPCSFTINGTTTYLRLQLDVGPEAGRPGNPIVLQMGDRGLDPTTGQATWGPAMGPFKLVKQCAYAVTSP
jgi:hypothetical protein